VRFIVDATNLEILTGNLGITALINSGVAVGGFEIRNQSYGCVEAFSVNHRIRLHMHDLLPSADSCQTRYDRVEEHPKLSDHSFIDRLRGRQFFTKPKDDVRRKTLRQLVRDFAWYHARLSCPYREPT
jgi:hypothetical protein